MGGIAHPDITSTPYVQDRALRETQRRYQIHRNRIYFTMRFLLLIKAQLSEYPRPNKSNYFRRICFTREISIILPTIATSTLSLAWSL